ncbi:MAG: hypothetical protein L6422_09380 [Candidatus Marinimicrobia bacterium]|nr:hypothetical protein [Candidatus Neomarinimicrobiota bacterium]
MEYYRKYRKKTTLWIIGTVMVLLMSNLPGSNPYQDPVSFYTGIQLNDLSQQIHINPGWLVYTDNESYVRYSSQANSAFGGFKRYLDPGRVSDSYWSASGGKILAGNTLFSGTFAYRYQNIKEKAWTHNRQPYKGMPFVMADSSIGGFDLNGLLWQVSVSKALWKNRLYQGISIFYNVDEEYKDIFPRPSVKHRDLSISLGSGFIPYGDSRLGITVQYFSFQELMITSKYSLDQAKTPLFFKLRGLDTPLIFRGQTSEERLMTIEGFLVSLDGLLRTVFPDQLTFQTTYENAIADNVDGGAYPIEQGGWRSERYFYSAGLFFNLAAPVDLIFFSSGMLHKHNADHPDFDVEIYEQITRRLSGGVKLEFHPSNAFSFSPCLYVSSHTLKRTDKFNGILDYFPGTAIGAEIRTTFPLIKGNSGQINFGTDRMIVSESTVLLPREVGFYYQTVTRFDEDYFETEFQDFRINSRIAFGKQKRVILEADYHHIVPIGTSNFDKKNRDLLSLVLSFEQLGL